MTAWQGCAPLLQLHCAKHADEQVVGQVGQGSKGSWGRRRPAPVLRPGHHGVPDEWLPGFGKGAMGQRLAGKPVAGASRAPAGGGGGRRGTAAAAAAAAPRAVAAHLRPGAPCQHLGWARSEGWEPCAAATSAQRSASSRWDTALLRPLTPATSGRRPGEASGHRADAQKQGRRRRPAALSRRRSAFPTPSPP